MLNSVYLSCTVADNSDGPCSQFCLFYFFVFNFYLLTLPQSFSIVDNFSLTLYT